MMTKIICTFVFSGLISIVCGQVLFEENFSTQIILAEPQKAKVQDGSLDYRFHQEKAYRLSIRDYTTGVVYKLDPAIGSDASPKTLYLSFCLRSLTETTKDKFAGVVLYKEDREVFGLGNDYASEYFSFWGADGKGITIGMIPTRVDDAVHKIVMRIDFNPSGPEKIRVGLDPFCRRSEDRQPDHIWTEYEYELSFDEMRLRSGNSDSVWEFDEIRIGSDWASVNPPDDNPGLYINQITEKNAPAGKAEMISDRVARFWPSADSPASAFTSLALEKEWPASGPLAPEWQLKPRFGIVQEKRYIYLDISSEVDLYGTGEVAGSLLRNGYKITLFNKDNFGYGKPDQLYQSHPWVLGLRPDGSAFGVIFDTTWMAELDLRVGILFSTPAQAPDFPVIIMEGKSPQEIMEKLGDLTGTMPMPPRWALGYHQCRYSYNPDSRVRQIADTFRAKQIPCDVIWLDIDYMNGFRIFTFDPNQFPDPKGLNRYLHDAGYKSIWMIDPGVKRDPGYFVYDSGTREDVWVKDASGNSFVGPVWPGDCVFPDFTMPSVRLWWSGLYADFMAQGIDGIWNDMNEPAVFNEKTGGTMPLDCQHRGGGLLKPGPHIQYHNVYGMLMVQASREGIQKANPQKRPFVLSRANFLGGQRYAATWTGDNKATWEHLKWSIPMSLNLSLSGQPFNGPDIGGFNGNAAPQLWAHWISVGAFYPFSRAHSEKGTDDQEPWAFGKATEEAARIALQRRYRLMPYLYTLFRQSHETGLPVMRPVFFADPSDVALRMEDQAFLVGSDLMVIPKWAASVQLPRGIWRSISLAGEDAIRDPFQCDLKIRGGAIVPAGPIVQTTEELLDKSPLTLFVVLDSSGQAEGVLYEDAGDGYGWQQEEFCFSIFKAQQQGDHVLVRCSQQQGKWVSQKRLVTVAVVDEQGISYGFGDICSGVKVLR